MNIRLPRTVVAAIGFLFVTSLLGAFVYGVVVQRYRIFPFRHIAAIEEAVSWSVDQATGAFEWYYRELENAVPEPKFAAGFDTGQLYLLSLFGPDNRMFIRVIDAAGSIRNEWSIDWFELWPDATHLPPSVVPKMQPGTNIHGVEMMDNGDIVFSLENLGLFRMSACGEVIWKLPYQTHHSIHKDERGDLWMSGRITHRTPVEQYPNHTVPFFEPSVIKVSPDGEILREISIFDVLVKNNLRAYLHLSSIRNNRTDVSGDTLHLNDVEVFPESMAEGIFRHGDVMVSLRNISTILVFDPDTLEVRYLKTGGFTRQHDPDFIDGNTLSVFDNNNIAPKTHGHQSRILILSADSGDITTWYEGTAEAPFYTVIMGKHQWVSEREVLIADAKNGRVIQVDADGVLLWEYYNKTDDNVVGAVGDALLLPDSISALFAESQRTRCFATP